MMFIFFLKCVDSVKNKESSSVFYDQDPEDLNNQKDLNNQNVKKSLDKSPPLVYNDDNQALSKTKKNNNRNEGKTIPKQVTYAEIEQEPKQSSNFFGLTILIISSFILVKLVQRMFANQNKNDETIAGAANRICENIDAFNNSISITTCTIDGRSGKIKDAINNSIDDNNKIKKTSMLQQLAQKFAPSGFFETPANNQNLINLLSSSLSKYSIKLTQDNMVEKIFVLLYLYSKHKTQAVTIFVYLIEKLLKQKNFMARSMPENIKNVLFDDFFTIIDCLLNAIIQAIKQTNNNEEQYFHKFIKINLDVVSENFNKKAENNDEQTQKNITAMIEELLSNRLDNTIQFIASLINEESLKKASEKRKNKPKKNK